jgi:hypothetical protein
MGEMSRPSLKKIVHRIFGFKKRGSSDAAAQNQCQIIIFLEILELKTGLTFFILIAREISPE